MSIDKSSGAHDQMSVFHDSPAETHSTFALEQSALNIAQLAIARWVNGGMAPHLPAATVQPPSSRALWYAQAQQNLQEWLGRGGFAQYDLSYADLCDPSDATLPPAAAAPQASSDTPHADTCID